MNKKTTAMTCLRSSQSIDSAMRSATRAKIAVIVIYFLVSLNPTSENTPMAPNSDGDSFQAVDRRGDRGMRARLPKGFCAASQ